MEKNCTESQFLEDVAAHEMNVLLDSGVHRHLRFANTKRDSWYMHFTLTTWPGYLCITGDMGCFVFTRLNDMFEFFRTKPEEDSRIYINPGYWSEKCEAADRRTNGMDHYDEDRFRLCVTGIFKEHEFESDEAKAACWQEIEDYLFTAENEYEAFSKARDFECEGFELNDFWEHRLRSWSYHYIWCLYAIAWGIRQYDQRQAGAHAGTGPTTDLARSDTA